MAFKDYEQVVDGLVLPIKGKKYTIPGLGVLEGIKLTEHLDPTSDAPALSDQEFQQFVLGDAYEQMLADNVPADAVRRAAMTAYADYQRGRAVAETLWETGGDPKAIRERVEAAMTPPAAATTTKRRATGTGTKTSPKS